MKKAVSKAKRASRKTSEEMRPKYDFRGGVRGKYAEAYAQGANLVRLDPEISKAFPNSAAVNEALHVLLSLAKRTCRAR